MSIPPFPDLSGALNLGPVCVSGGGCAGALLSGDYGPVWNDVGPLAGGGQGCVCYQPGGCQGSCPGGGSCGCGGGGGDGDGGGGCGSAYFSRPTAFLGTGAGEYCACAIGQCLPLKGFAPFIPGRTLPAPPGPGSPYSQAVKVVASNVIGTPTLSDLWITCEQSGVTLSAACAGVTFYHPDNASKTYTTPAGPAVNCTTGLVGTVRSGSATGTPPAAVTIGVRE